MTDSLLLLSRRGANKLSLRAACPLADVIYVTRPHQLLIDSQPQITCCIDPLDLLTKDMDGPAIFDVPRGLKEIRRFSRRRWLHSTPASSAHIYWNKLRYSASSAIWRDVPVTAVSSTYSANSTWREGVVFSHTQAEKDGRETRVPRDTRTRCAWNQHRQASSCHQNKFRELCFEWSRTHSIALCNWNTLQKVPDAYKERKHHFGIHVRAASSAA